MPGRETEETGWISFFEHGKLQFAAPVGIRIHGGVSRRYAPYGYRLSFRSEHGTAGLPGGLVSPELERLPAAIQPLARVLVTEGDDEDTDGSVWAFPGEVAYEIGRALGAEAPRTRPVWFSLNGGPAALYSLSEHIDADFLRRHYGHDNFELHRGKRDPDDPRRDSDESDRFWAGELAWIAAAPAPFTRAVAAERYDLDKLITWLVTVLFNGTGDIYQEAMIRDRTGELASGRWTWIHWDHDMSFRTPPKNSRFGNKRDLLPYVLDNQREIRSPQQALMLRLVEEDPEFRAELVRRTTQALNHQLTPGVPGEPRRPLRADREDPRRHRPRLGREAPRLLRLAPAGDPHPAPEDARRRRADAGRGHRPAGHGQGRRLRHRRELRRHLPRRPRPRSRSRARRPRPLPRLGDRDHPAAAEPRHDPTLRFTVWGPTRDRRPLPRLRSPAPNHPLRHEM